MRDTSHRPLSLNDRQLALIRETANHVPHDWRSLYLSLVVDFLEGDGGEPNDARIAAAVKHAWERLHIHADPPCVGGR